jgi:hypothetical protein
LTAIRLSAECADAPLHVNPPKLWIEDHEAELSMIGQWWLWLFPLTYAVHIAEEGLAGERFYRWIARFAIVRSLGIRISGREFLTLNGIFMGAMLAAVSAASWSGYSWLTPALGMLVAVNGLGHLAGSLATRSYSPGLISGIFL